MAVPAVKTLLSAFRDYGVLWVLQRGFYEFRVKSGWLRARFPARGWWVREWTHWCKSGRTADAESLFEEWKSHGACHFVNRESIRGATGVLGAIMGTEGRRRLLHQADALLEGHFPYFFTTQAYLSFPPDWRLNPFTGGRAENCHWSKLPMLSRAYGDIKYLWEPGRFASAFILARAFALTGDDRYAEGFWLLVESWGQQCPPNMGPHWACGQEMALRVLAWLFALYVFRDSPETTAERFAGMAGMIAAQVDRIVRNHIYARLQRNNHSISEGTGIFAAGLLLPFMRGADSWVRRGFEILCREAVRLIASDGTFGQKSHNYHRLMLHAYLYAIRLGELNGVVFPQEVVSRVQRAVDYLCEVMDLESGQVPNFGANDGALILPLNTCDFTDFRPVCQAGRFLLEGKRWLEEGPWNEDLLWLFGREALQCSRGGHAQSDLQCTAGGIYTIHGDRSWAFLHCESFRQRPSHADSLNVDLWWRGQNIACDAGTYLYYSDPPWDNALAGTAVHNTVAVDGEDQMDRGPRFMWTNWHKARVLRFDYHGQDNIVVWEGEHDGYSRLSRPVIHRRALVLFGKATWIVVDTLLGSARHRCTLHWLLGDFPYEVRESGHGVRLSTAAGDYCVYSCQLFPGDYRKTTDLVRAQEDGVRGWVSRYYGRRDPALSFSLEVEGLLPGGFLTVFSPSAVTSRPSRGRCILETTEGAIELRVPDSDTHGGLGKLILSPVGGRSLTINF